MNDDADILRVMLLKARWAHRRVRAVVRASGKVEVWPAEGPPAPRPLLTFTDATSAIAWIQAQRVNSATALPTSAAG